MEEKIFSENIIILTHRISALATERYRRELAKIGVTVWTWRVLGGLLERENVRLSDLAELLRVEISTLSRAVAVMEKQNLITRQYRTEEDSRALSIRLTTEGRELAQKIFPIFQRYSELYMEGISPADRAVLKKHLLRIYDNVASAPKPRRRRLKSANATARGD